MVLKRDVDRRTTCDAARTVDVLAALASPHRLAIVRLLETRDHDVGQLAARLGISVANTSHHLSRLRRAGLVTSRRDGTRMINRLASHEVAALAGAACAVLRSKP